MVAGGETCGTVTLSSTFVLEGRLSVTAALEASQREIFRILIDSDKRFDRRSARLRQAAASAGVACEFVTAETIAAHASGKTHGGVIALVGERQYVSLADLIPDQAAPFVVMLDGIEDPYNFAFAIRALYAAGVNGLVLRPRNWTSASAVVGRASAGSIERMPLAIAASAEDAAEFYRERGLLVAAAAKSASGVSLYNTDLTRPLFVLVGGEKRGVTRSFRNRADLLLEIPYGRDFAGSLGTVSAATLIAFEVLRQRRAADM